MHEESNTPQHRVPRSKRTCQHCAGEFEVLESQSLVTGRPFCSLACAYEARKTSMEERFWQGVEKTKSCWIWKRAKSHDYGVLALPGHGAGWMRADIFSYELHFGPLPEGGKIHHTCPGGPRKDCVNPAHLAPGSKPRKERKKRVSSNPRPQRLPRVCAQCGKPFSVQPAVAAMGGGKYCNRSCQGKAQARPLEERFWEKVEKNGPLPPSRPELGPCSIWKGARTKDGYGILSLDGKAQKTAHRIALILDGRPAADDEDACHHCDVKLCVRFDHLYPGTPTDNNRDAVMRGHKGRRGPAGSGELNPVAVRVIRFLWDNRQATQAALARAHRVHPTTIQRVIRRQIWDHIE